MYSWQCDGVVQTFEKPQECTHAQRLKLSKLNRYQQRARKHLQLQLVAESKDKLQNEMMSLST